MVVKEFFETHFHQNIEIWAILILTVIFEQPWKSTAVYRWIRTQRFKTIIFCFDCVYNSWKYVLYSY